MAILFYLLILMVFGVVVLQLVFGFSVMKLLGKSSEVPAELEGGTGNAVPQDPGSVVEKQLEGLELAQARLRAHYPILSRMLSGYLHAEALSEEGGLERAVREMVLDWHGEKDSVQEEITRILAENPEESTVRAIILSLCDAEFEHEGYRNWLIWLQGQFNDL